GKDVEMYCLESRETMPASKNEIVEAEIENITINNGWGPKEVIVKADGSVKEIVFMRCLSTVDENGKFNPKYDENDITIVPADYVIYAIGQSIEWNKLLEGSKVQFWHGNYPVADPLTYQSDEEDIFFGGDVYTGPKFVIDAIEQGHQAADSLHRFVQPGTSMTIGKNRREFIMLDKDNIDVVDYDHAQRQYEGMDESIDYSHSFKDAHKTLTEEQVKIETSRCLSCGASVVDENKCIGCGICTTKCEFDAIHLFRDHPENSKMIKSENKFSAIIPYALKRAVKIKFAPKTEEEKKSEQKHKEWKKAQKEAKKHA
ncbi:MAG: 4Fe-4S binding protein, partial [Erysipelotrichaceae bacterium]|nr:4Fe-4S binding protein [Erysipelotrichaceae bacterium]